MKLPKDFKIGISFSGGASYGIAHIGVIKALREYGIEPDVVYGTSAGAMASVLYAGGASIREFRDFARGSKILKMVRWKYPKLGLIPLDYLENRIGSYCPYDNLEELPVKTYIGATNLETGEHETLSKGNLAKAVTASCAIPVFFRPVELNGNLYVDGGVANNMPAKRLRQECDYVIGCNVVEKVFVGRNSFKGFKRVMERTLTISLLNRTVVNYPDCDFIIRPTGMANRFGKFDFGKVDEMIELGYQKTLRDLPAILEGIQSGIKTKYNGTHSSKKSDYYERIS